MEAWPDHDGLQDIGSSVDLKVFVQDTDLAKTLRAATLGTEGELNALKDVTAGTVTASKALVVDASKDLATLGNLALTTLNSAYPVLTQGISFTEAGSTTYTGTIEVAAGTIVHDVGFTNTVLWDDTGAVALIVGDDDDDNGWFTSTNLKATDLLVGEVLSAADDGTWGGVNGVYLTAAGRRGRTTAGFDSGWYYGAAAEIIFKVTAANGDGTAGRSFGWVRYSVPTFTAATGT